jgi:hypothetical protein
MSLGALLPIVLFLVLGVVGLYALQVAKNVAYVAFLIMFGMLTWYVGAPVIRHYVLNEQVASQLPPEEGKVAREIIGNFNELPSKEIMQEKMKPAMDKAKEVVDSGVSGELHAAAGEEEGQDGEEHEKSILDKILKAVFQTVADSF